MLGRGAQVLLDIHQADMITTLSRATRKFFHEPRLGGTLYEYLVQQFVAVETREQRATHTDRGGEKRTQTPREKKSARSHKIPPPLTVLKARLR